MNKERSREGGAGKEDRKRGTGKGEQEKGIIPKDQNRKKEHP